MPEAVGFTTARACETKVILVLSNFLLRGLDDFPPNLVQSCEDFCVESAIDFGVDEFFQSNRVGLLSYLDRDINI